MISLLAAAPAQAATFPEQRLQVATTLAAPDLTARERIDNLLRLGDLEERAGNPDLSSAALSAALRIAGVAAGIDALAPGLVGADGQAPLDKVVAAAVAADNRRGDATLFLDAAAWQPEVASRRGAALRTALLARRHGVRAELHETLASIFAHEPVWQAFLRPDHPDDASRLSNETLVAAGQPGWSILDERLSAALQRRDLATARGLADGLIRGDRWHLSAQVVRLLLNDLPALGTAITAADVAATVDPGRGAATVALVLDRARQAQPAAIGVAVALAYRYLTVGLFADARREAAATAATPGATADQRATAQQIEALAALEARDEASAARWAQASGAALSPVWSARVLERLLPWSREHLAPPSPMARAALRTIFAAPFGPATHQNQSRWAQRAALAFDDADLRARGLAVLKVVDGRAGQLVDDCLRRIVAADECGARLRLQGRWLIDDEDDDDRYHGSDSDRSSLGDVLERLPDIPASALQTWARLPTKELVTLAPKLSRLRTDRYLGTPGMAALEIAVALATHDRATAQASFARWRPVFPRGQRLALALMFAAPAGQGKNKAKARSADGNTPTLPTDLPSVTTEGAAPVAAKPAAKRDDDDDSDDSDDDDSDADGDGGGGEPTLAAVLGNHVRQPAAALARLLRDWKRVPGPDGVELAGWVWLLAHRAHKAGPERAALARIDALSPGSDVAVRVGVELELERGNLARARALAARLWLAAPSHDPSQLFATAWARALSPVAVSIQQQAWMRRFGEHFFGAGWRQLASGFRRGRIRSETDLRAVVESLTDTARALDTWPDPDHPGGDHRWWIEEQLGTLPAGELVPFARRVQTFVARLEGAPTIRPQAFWAAYLAGDLPAARQALRAPDSPTASQLNWVRPEPDNDADPRPLLADMREPPDTALRQTIFNAIQRRSRQKGDLPARLAERADHAPASDAARWRELACLTAARLDRVREGLALCGRAWALPLRTRALARTLGDLLASDPAAARLENVDGAAFFKQAAAAGSKVMTPHVHHRHARWLSEAGRSAEAAAAEAAAWAGGYHLGISDGAGSLLEWAHRWPLLARVTAGAALLDDFQRNQTAGLLAMMDGDPAIGLAHLRAASAGLADSDPGKHRQEIDIVLDVTEIGAADLARGRLNRAGLVAVMGSFFQHGGKNAAEMTRSYPASLAARLLAADAGLSQLRAPPIADATALVNEFPGNVTVIQIAVGTLTMAKRFSEAAALLAAAQKALPGNRRLEALNPPSAAATALPPWAANPRALNDALGAVEPMALLGAGVRAETSAEDLMSAFVPTDFHPDAARGFTFIHNGVHLTGYRAPRVTHCLAAVCLEEMAAMLAGQSIEELWIRPVRLPVGAGHEGMFRGPGGLVLVSAVPVGPHVFYVSAGGPAERLGAALATVRLFRDTFQVTDAALGPARTALLRRGGIGRDADTSDARARLQLARSSRGNGSSGQPVCPIESILGTLDSATVRDRYRRSWLLTSLFLGTADADDRARLLACATPGWDDVAGLGLAALWDVTPEGAAFGRAVLARRPREVAELLRSGLDLGHQPVAGDSLNDPDRLVAGVIQAAAALPASSAHTLVQRLASAGEPRLRTLALAALRWVPAALPVIEKATILREGPDADAAVLAAGLPDVIEGPLLAAARARVDALRFETAAQRALIVQLSWRLARALDAADTTRLAAARTALAGRVMAGEPGVKAALRAIDAHAAGTSSGSKTPAAARDQAARWARAAVLPGPVDPRWPEASLRSRIPDRGWGYIAIPKPATFVAGLADATGVGGRAVAGSASPGALLLARIFSNLGVDRLADGGVDLDRPFECAVSEVDAEHWICAASVSDPALVRRRLAAGTARDLGLALPLTIARPAAMLPMLNVFLPLMLPTADGATVSAGRGPANRAPAATGWLVTEQVRDVVHHGSIDLSRTTDLRVSGDHLSTFDQTLTWLSPRRLWLFSDQETAHDWLSMAGRSGPEPAWLDNAAASTPGLLGAWPPGDPGRETHVAALALDSTSQGLRIRVRSSQTGPVASATALDRYLPPGATARFRSANVSSAPIWGFQPAVTGAAVTPRGPPVWLWRSTAAVAFGWYPPAREATGEAAKTERWLVAVPWDWATSRLWLERRLPAPTDTPTVAADGALVFARDRDALVLASEPGLLDTALAAARKAPAAAQSSPATPALLAAIAGRPLADAMERQARNAPPGTRASDTLHSWASLSTLLSSMETTGTASDGVFTSETWLRVAATGGNRSGSSIEEWLHSQRLKNSLRLPRTLGGEDAARPLTFLLRGTASDDIRRAFPGSARASITSVDARQARLKVLPAPPPGSGGPLSSDQQRLYLDGDTGPAPPPLRATARDIAGAQTSPWEKARAVVSWVHREMTYEITPRGVDDVTLLSNRRGDCTEYAQLTVALLRALGVPARRHEGLMVGGNSMVAHAWAEFHDGQGWHEIDPSAGRTTVDAAYVDASVIDLLPLLTDGRIEITAVE